MNKFISWVGNLFNLAPTTKIAVLIFIGLFALGLALSKCHAAEPNDAPYAQLSAGSTIVRGVAPVLDFTLTEPAPQLNKAYFQESITLVGSSTFKGQAAPNNYFFRGLFVDGFGHFDIGLGVCWIDNPQPYNGQHLNMNLQLAYRFTVLPITATYSHCSDAGTQLPNYGRDILMIGARF